MRDSSPSAATRWRQCRGLLAGRQDLASASADQTLRLWEVASGKELLTLSGHEDSVMWRGLLAGRQELASASEDRPCACGSPLAETVPVC